MPCVSLMHRRIYKNTVARRIAMNKLCRTTEKTTAKSIKKAAKSQAIATKTALKTAKKLAKQSRKASRKAPRNINTLQSPASNPTYPVQPTASTTPSVFTRPEPSLASTQPVILPQRPKVEYISSVMQEFHEGIEVQILHSKPRISVDNVLATSTISQLKNEIIPEHIQAPSELFASNSEQINSAQSLTDPKKHARRFSRTELINAESSLGRTLFGPIPAGHRREFFHDRGNVWIWHESWIETSRQSHQVTIRYEVRPTGVYKKLAAGNYVELVGNELENFRYAAHAYLHLIKHNLYHLA